MHKRDTTEKETVYELRAQQQPLLIPWRKEWLPTPIFLPGKSHGQRSLTGLVHVAESGCRVGHNWTTNTTFLRGWIFRSTGITDGLIHKGSLPQLWHSTHHHTHTHTHTHSHTCVYSLVFGDMQKVMGECLELLWLLLFVSQKGVWILKGPCSHRLISKITT